MPKTKLEDLKAKNKKLKEEAEVKALERENKHLEHVSSKTDTSGRTITVIPPTVAVMTKAENIDSDEKRGKYLIEVICQLTQEQITSLSFEDFKIHRDIVQSFF